MHRSYLRLLGILFRKVNSSVQHVASRYEFLVLRAQNPDCGCFLADRASIHAFWCFLQFCSTEWHDSLCSDECGKLCWDAHQWTCQVCPCSFFRDDWWTTRGWGPKWKASFKYHAQTYNLEDFKLLARNSWCKFACNNVSISASQVSPDGNIFQNRLQEFKLGTAVRQGRMLWLVVSTQVFTSFSLECSNSFFPDSLVALFGLIIVSWQLSKLPEGPCNPRARWSCHGGCPFSGGASARTWDLHPPGTVMGTRGYISRLCMQCNFVLRTVMLRNSTFYLISCDGCKGIGLAPKWCPVAVCLNLESYFSSHSQITSVPSTKPFQKQRFYVPEFLTWFQSGRTWKDGMRNRRTKGRISTKRSSDKNTAKNVNDDDPPLPPSGRPTPPPPPPARPLPQSPPPTTMIVVVMLMVMLLIMVRIIGCRRRQRLTCADEDKEGTVITMIPICLILFTEAVWI